MELKPACLPHAPVGVSVSIPAEGATSSRSQGAGSVMATATKLTLEIQPILAGVLYSNGTALGAAGAVTAVSAAAASVSTAVSGLAAC